jgi:ribonuclease E
MSESTGAPTSADQPTSGPDTGRPDPADAASGSDGGAGGEGERGTSSTTSTTSTDGDRPRSRGSRGGRGRGGGSGGGGGGGRSDVGRDREPELPDRIGENRPSAEAADKAVVRKAEASPAPAGHDADGKPRIGDTRPAPKGEDDGTGERSKADGGGDGDGDGGPRKRRRRGGRGRGGGGGGGNRQGGQDGGGQNGGGQRGGGGGRERQGGRNEQPVQAIMGDGPVELDEEELKGRRGRERKGKAVGRYLMVVSKRAEATQIAVLEGRMLTEHFVSRPQDDISQIHGNIYLGKVQNVLPGMEAAFVDIGTPKNAVLYRGDVQYDPEDVEERGQPRIEQILKAKQTILCQVTKNPIGAKGARLTQEVSLPGRFVVLIPNSKTYGISKRLPDAERKRLRSTLDKVKPAQHGVIVRTAAEGVTNEEIERDVRRLVSQWEQIDALAKKSSAPQLLYREPDMAVRVIREEFNKDYRGVVIDDPDLHREVHDYVSSISPATADRVEHYDRGTEPLSVFERYHVHEQLHRALDRKVWLPSGGSLIIEHTEALTVVDVNTGKNVGKSSLEETVYRNNLEAADEIARQLRLRDIGGIIVIDFIDMEVKSNRADVIKRFREALARDKTRTQVFDISELGLVEMTRKRIGEGLLESLSTPCEVCEARGVVIDQDLLGSA